MTGCGRGGTESRREYGMFELLANSFSQSGQESFVLNMLNMKTDGFYVEIGAYHSTDLSNTYVLESQFSWKGVAFEIDPKKSKEYNRGRSNLCVTADATNFNYSECFEKLNTPAVIDYLQVDIEPAFQSLAALKLLPWDEYTFKVITFEHDLYVNPENEVIQQEAFDLLSGHGYSQVAKNVKSNGLPYEDWYCYPDFVSEDMKSVSLASDSEWRTFFL